jgi:hypothetical protein
MTEDELKTAKEEQQKYFDEFIKLHTGELMLDCFEVVRFEGFVDHDEDDFYWRAFSLITGVYRTSCVGKLIPLKGFLPEQDYKHLESIFNMNLPTQP